MADAIDAGAETIAEPAWATAADWGKQSCLFNARHRNSNTAHRLVGRFESLAFEWCNMGTIGRRAILQNEGDYPDPSAFKPERYLDQNGVLDPTVLDPAVAAFGFGRRCAASFILIAAIIDGLGSICPGRHLAYSNTWLMIASILSTFDITKTFDENGEVIEPPYEMKSALVW